MMLGWGLGNIIIFNRIMRGSVSVKKIGLRV